MLCNLRSQTLLSSAVSPYVAYGFPTITNFQRKLPGNDSPVVFIYTQISGLPSLSSPDSISKQPSGKHLSSWSYSRASYHFRTALRFCCLFYFMLKCPKGTKKFLTVLWYKKTALSLLSELCNSFISLRKQKYPKMFQSWKLPVIAFRRSMRYNMSIGYKQDITNHFSICAPLYLRSAQGSRRSAHCRRCRTHLSDKRKTGSQ